MMSADTNPEFELNEAVQVYFAAHPRAKADDLLQFAQLKAKEFGAKTCCYDLVSELMRCE